MLIEISENNDHVIVKLLSDILMANTVEFNDEFQIIIQKRPTYLSFDFQDVKFVDSSGIGILIKEVNIMINSAGAKISAFNMHKSLYSVFKLSGLDNIMELYQDAGDFYKKYPELKNNK